MPHWTAFQRQGYQPEDLLNYFGLRAPVNVEGLAQSMGIEVIRSPSPTSKPVLWVDGVPRIYVSPRLSEVGARLSAALSFGEVYTGVRQWDFAFRLTVPQACLRRSHLVFQGDLGLIARDIGVVPAAIQDRLTHLNLET